MDCRFILEESSIKTRSLLTQYKQNYAVLLE